MKVIVNQNKTDVTPELGKLFIKGDQIVLTVSVAPVYQPVKTEYNLICLVHDKGKLLGTNFCELDNMFLWLKEYGWTLFSGSIILEQ